MKSGLSRCLVALVSMVSCHQVMTSLGAQPTPLTREFSLRHQQKMEIYQALELAVKDLRRKRQMQDKFKLRASRNEGEWVFYFIFQPEKPGNDITVFVADTGKLRYLPGF